MDEKILDRYRKVKALAEKGADGEKVAAQKILERMQRKHPGIDRAASAEPVVAPDPFPGSDPRAPGGAWSRVTGNWENIFQYAAGVYRTVQEVVEEVSDVLYGQELADEEVVWKAGASRKSVYLNMRMSHDAMFEARELTPAQQEMFRQALHGELDRYLDSLLAVSD
jgi:hypothetical protein